MSHELLYVLDLSLTVSLFMLTFNLDLTTMSTIHRHIYTRRIILIH